MRDDGRLVIGLSGRTKAGKSAIAHALGERLGWPWASFGEYVRSEARLTGRSEDRESLQELGVELIDRLGWDTFCRRTLDHARLDSDSVPCIVEGIRHVEVLRTLRDLFAPFPVYLIHLRLADEERDRRLAAEGIDPRRGVVWEQHSTERDVAKALPDRADLHVKIEETPDASVATILDWLKAA
jgi:chloramphenicol 3-O-phosphotransferase